VTAARPEAVTPEWDIGPVPDLDAARRSGGRKEVTMTLLRERIHTDVQRTPVVRHTAELTLGVLGTMAGLVGLYMYSVPADWFLGGLAAGWYLAMFVASGMLLGTALAIYAREAYLSEGAWTGGVTAGTLFSALAFVAALVFLFIAIL
jgi:hypothetical protein